MLATLQALFNALRTTATAEARSLSRVLFFLIMSTYTMAAIQAAFGSQQNAVLIIGVIVIFLNVFQLFRVGRLIRLTAVGEALELARVTPTQAGIISNKLISTYWQIAVQLTVIISVFCIATPFMPLWRAWWVPIVWPTLFVFAGVALGSVGRKFFRLALTLEILALIFAVSNVMFPQINAQLRIGELSSRFIKTDLADDVNAIEGIRKSQRDAEIKRDLSEVSEWVQKNPNGKYSDDYSKFLESIKSGERKTLNEIRYEILHPPIKPPKSSEEKPSPEWEKVSDCQIHFSGRTFSTTVGPDGERANTGEVYTECFLENGYDYKITFSGEYTKKLITQEHKVSWRGFNPQSQGIAKPFPDYDFGALMLRIGNQVGIHPEKGKDFVVFAPMDSEKVFAEINVNRDPEEYHDSKGSKLKNSTLSIKIERRPL